LQLKQYLLTKFRQYDKIKVLKLIVKNMKKIKLNPILIKSIPVLIGLVFVLGFFNTAAAQTCEGGACAPILIIGKSVDKIIANPGDEIVYTVNYRNIGEGTATGVVVKDLLNYINQSYLTFVSANPQPTSGTGTWSIGTLGPGEMGVITITARIDPTNLPVGTTEIKNIAYIDSNETAMQNSNCTSTFVTKVGNPILSITKSVNKTNASVGDEIVYTLNYKNTGAGPASNVVIYDPFNNLNQEYLTFISADPHPNSGNDTWNIGSLDPGQSGQITITARISNSVPAGKTEIKNRASIDSTETSQIYSNYVSTYVSSTVKLSINKLVRNISKGGTDFVNSVNADPEDEVEFSLEIGSSGSNLATNVLVKDSLPSRLKYILGSTTVDGSSYSDGIVSGGINIGNLTAGATKLVKFRAKLDKNEMFNVGTTTLTNYGYVSADGISAISDTAIVTIYKPSGCSPSLQINKTARNITQGYGLFTDTVYANPGDEIEFSIKITSVGNETAQNSRVRDELPSKLTYISGSTTVDGILKPNDIINTSGLYIGDLAVGAFREIRFKAKIDSGYIASNVTLNNVAYAWSDKICSQINDPAQIVISPSTVNPSYILNISKSGRNITKGQSDWSDSISANPQEEIEFYIQVTNSGNVNLTNVRVWDALPQNIDIISGTTTIDGVSWGGDVIGAGLNIGTLEKNRTRIIKFRARVGSQDKFNTTYTTLVNNAYALADNASQVSDQTSVIVYRAGQVLGAALVKTGANMLKMLFLAIISALIAFILYCKIREEKLLKALNNPQTNKLYRKIIETYFRLSLMSKRLRARI